MTQPHQLFFLHAVTPLHVGVEDTLGGVDLPTMKERHTGYPLVPGSSIKGVLRTEVESAPGISRMERLAAFGPETAEAGDYRGGLVFTDARLLALPVRSLCGTFAWVTCHHLLSRLARDLKIGGLPGVPVVAAPAKEIGLVPGIEGGEDDGGLRPDSALLVGEDERAAVFLEESILAVRPDEDLATVAAFVAEGCWPGDSEAADLFRRRLLLVHDDLFGFLVRLALEVRARVRIDASRGTAADSGPWTEEHMPAETLLHGLVMGRFTTYRERRGDGGPNQDQAGSAGEVGEAASDDSVVPRKGDQNLAVLGRVAADLGLLRFGGHSTVGLGRAFFRLVPTSPSGGKS